jgi:hypothetical protein
LIGLVLDVVRDGPHANSALIAVGTSSVSSFDLETEEGVAGNSPPEARIEKVHGGGDDVKSWATEKLGGTPVPLFR